MGVKVYEYALSVLQKSLDEHIKVRAKLVTQLRQLQQKVASTKGIRQKLYQRRIKEYKIRLKYYNLIVNRLKQIIKVVEDFIRKDTELSTKLKTARQIARTNYSTDVANQIRKLEDAKAQLLHDFAQKIIQHRKDVARIQNTYAARIIGRSAIAAFLGLGIFALAKKIIQRYR